MIKSFFGKFRFLSNFWPAEVVFEGKKYPSVEHAYQAAKTLDEAVREEIRIIPKAGDVKKRAKTIELREGWDALKDEIMFDLLKQKFAIPEFKEKLLATGEEELVEGNNWGDVYWGICKGVGQNKLGKMLMDIRNDMAPRT